MRRWLRHHAASSAGTVRRLSRTPLATLLNVLVIGVTLSLPLGAYVLLDNLQRLAGHFGANPQISVFLASDAARTDIDRVAAEIAGEGDIRGSRFVPRDDALAALKQSEGMADIVNSLKSNPLPDAFVIELATNNPATARALATKLGALPKVAQVQFDSAWVQRLHAILRLGRTAVVLLAGLLAFGLVAVTFNTIRLQVLTQRDEIEVAKLVGATNAYVRRPFFYQGALLGAAGGVAALMIVGATVWILNRDVAAVAESYGSGFLLAMPRVSDTLALVLFAALLGWMGAYLAVSRHLHSLRSN